MAGFAASDMETFGMPAGWFARTYHLGGLHQAVANYNAGYNAQDNLQEAKCLGYSCDSSYTFTAVLICKLTMRIFSREEAPSC